MRTIQIYPRFARALLAGKKTWEYRKEESRPYYIGERVHLVVVGEKSKRATGQEFNLRVTYLHRGWPIPDGHVCMSVKVLPAPKEEP